MKKFAALWAFVLAAVVVASVGAAESVFTVQFLPGRIRWNPHYAYTTTEAQIFTALHEGLVVYHPATLRPVEGAAESWSVSDDGLVWTFSLREDLRWSNGERITSEDFRESWLTLLSPNTGSEYASLLDNLKGAKRYRTGIGAADDVGLSAPDIRTFVVELEKPSPQFLSILCHYSFVPVHRDFRDKPDWSAHRSVPVSGPFVMKARNEDETIFVRNPEYWDADTVALDRVHLRFDDDPGQIMEEFNSYRTDWIISGMDTARLAIPEALTISPLFSTTYFYFSNRRSPWNDGKVRRALAKLLTWEDLQANRLIPGSTLVPPIPNYPEGEGPFDDTPDTDGAFALLEAAGYPGGQGLPDIIIRVPGEDAAAGIMKQTWEAALPLKVIIDVVPFPRYYDALKGDDYDLGTLTWTGDYADPLTFLGMWESDSSFNDARFSDEIFDGLLDEAAGLPFRERMSKLREAEERLLLHAQVIPLEHYPSVNLIDRRFVEGWYPNALDIHPFKNITVISGFAIPGVVRAPIRGTPPG